MNIFSSPKATLSKGYSFPFYFKIINWVLIAYFGLGIIHVFAVATVIADNRQGGFDVPFWSLYFFFTPSILRIATAIALYKRRKWALYSGVGGAIFYYLLYVVLAYLTEHRLYIVPPIFNQGISAVYDLYAYFIALIPLYVLAKKRWLA